MGWIADRTLIAVEDIFKRMDLDADPLVLPRFRRFIKWFGYSAIPFIFNVASVLAMLYIFNLAYNNIGFERTAIVLLVLIWARSRK